MLTSSALARHSAAVLQMVFGSATMEASAAMQAAFSIQPDEQIVASLRFFGDYSGQAYMVLRKDDIHAVVARVLARFDIETPVEDSVVLAELMNIYQAQLTAALRSDGVAIQIGTPLDASDIRPDSLDGQTVLAVDLQGERGIAYRFCYVQEADVAP